jgi:F-box and WD-40 domain protein 1/11
MPLDGEEGELVEDEGFLDSFTVPPRSNGTQYPSHSLVLPPKRLDILFHLPAEIAMLVFLHICDLPTLASASRVSRYWYELANDQQIWREMFARKELAQGWVVNPTRMKEKLQARLRLDSHASSKTRKSAFVSPVVLYNRWGRNSLLSLRSLDSMCDCPDEYRSRDALAKPRREFIPLTLAMDWKEMYKSRLEIDIRWNNGEPRAMYFEGHTDRFVLRVRSTEHLVNSFR